MDAYEQSFFLILKIRRKYLNYRQNLGDQTFFKKRFPYYIV